MASSLLCSCSCIIYAGDIAFRVLDELQAKNKDGLDEETYGHVTCCDINKSMLDVGKDRAQKVNKYLLDCSTDMNVSCELIY